MSFDRRYFSRQLSLDGFGPRAQKRLAASHVAVAGLGGTGCVAATNVALAGVGRVTLVDRDVVSEENLHRQPAYSLSDVGMSKAEAAASFLEERVTGLRVSYRAESLDEGNASRLIVGADVVLDCLDNMAARLALNRACAARRIPLVYTGSTGWDGSAAMFYVPETGCLECLVPEPPVEDLPACEDAGALGALTSYVGSIGALEAVKTAAGLPPSLMGRMLVLDGRTGESQVVALGKRPDCGACGSGAGAVDAPQVAELCGGREFYVRSRVSSREFRGLKTTLGGRARRMGGSIIVVADGPVEMSVFKSGGVLVKGAGSAAEALESLRRVGL